MAQGIADIGHTAVQEADRPVLYGFVAEFEEPETLIAAARRMHEAGYRRIDAYTPLPVEGLSEALGQTDHIIPWIMFVGGLTGAAVGFGMIYWTTVIDYPLNIGGRPLFAWPSYIPITFELTVLLSALTGIFGMFAVNGLPAPYHPVFDAPHFEDATSHRFFLGIEATDPRFDRETTRQFMETLGAAQVSEVELRK